MHIKDTIIFMHIRNNLQKYYKKTKVRFAVDMEGNGSASCPGFYFMN